MPGLLLYHQAIGSGVLAYIILGKCSADVRTEDDCEDTDLLYKEVWVEK